MPYSCVKVYLANFNLYTCCQLVPETMHSFYEFVPDWHCTREKLDANPCNQASNQSLFQSVIFTAESFSGG